MQVQLSYAGCPVNVTVPEGHSVNVRIEEGRLIVDIQQEAPTHARIDEQAATSVKPRLRKKAPQTAAVNPKGSLAGKGRVLSEDKLNKYQKALELVSQGEPKSRAAKAVGVSPGSFYSWCKRNGH